MIGGTPGFRIPLDVVIDASDHPPRSPNFDFEDVKVALPGSSEPHVSVRYSSTQGHSPRRRRTLPSVRHVPSRGASNHNENIPSLSTGHIPRHDSGSQQHDPAAAPPSYSRAPDIPRRIANIEDEGYYPKQHKSYPCQYPGCPRNFNVKSNMLRHFRSHLEPSISPLLEDPEDEGWESDEDDDAGKRPKFESSSLRCSLSSSSPKFRSSSSFLAPKNYNISYQTTSDPHDTQSPQNSSRVDFVHPAGGQGGIFSYFSRTSRHSSINYLGDEDTITATDHKAPHGDVLLLNYDDAFNRKSELCLDGRITRLSQHPVAFGGNADVWEGFMGNQKVAIKTVRPFSASGKRIPESTLRKRLRREYLSWSDLSHPNVVQCLGFSYDFSPSCLFPSLISPWMSNGTVFPYLERYPDTDRLELLLGVARGLSYLHSRSIVHGDLRAGNILILDSGAPCLSDFGLSRGHQVEEMTSTSEHAGTLRWMSPELLIDHVEASSSSDIWAYGMTVLEILSGNRPYYEFQKEAGVLGQLKDGQIPSRPRRKISKVPSMLTDEVWAMCQQCWILRPTERPSIDEVISKLVGCQSHHSEE